MTGLGRLHRVHAQAARFIGRAGKNFYVQTHELGYNLDKASRRQKDFDTTLIGNPKSKMA
ncbi:MAG TPA: hypothetical protein DCO65_01525 [Spartobacteria bacterium]|nr:hypothetical protein [Spartobacteria bacterium]